MLLDVHTPMHACTHVCMHAYVRIHLHPDMKIIKIKASDFYEKKNKICTCNFTSSEQSERSKFLVIILPICIHLNTCIIKSKAMDLHLEETKHTI